MSDSYDTMSVGINVTNNTEDVEEFIEDFKWMCSISHHGGFTGKNKEIAFRDYDDEGGLMCTIGLNTNYIKPDLRSGIRYPYIEFTVSSLYPDTKLEDIDRILTFIERMIAEYFSIYVLNYVYAAKGNTLLTNRNVSPVDLDYIAILTPSAEDMREYKDKFEDSILMSYVIDNIDLFDPNEYAYFTRLDVCKIFIEYAGYRDVIALDGSNKDMDNLRREAMLMSIVSEDTKMLPYKYQTKMIVKDQNFRVRIDNMIKYYKMGVDVDTALNRGDGEVVFYLRSLLYLQKTDDLFSELIEKGKQKLFTSFGEYIISMKYEDVMKLDNLPGDSLKSKLQKMYNKYSEFPDAYIALL